MKSLVTILKLTLKSRKLRESGDIGSIHLFFDLLKLYFISKYSKSKEEIVVQRIDQFIFYAYDYATLILLYQEIFLEKIYRFRSSTEKPFIVDCGANIGLSVLFFKKYYPHSEIWAFEPNPNSFTLLKKNIEANNIKGVRLFNYALSDENQTIDFYVPLAKGSVNGSSSKDIVDSEQIKADGRKLSDFIRGRKIDLIKIDVEGDEEKVIKDLVDQNLLPSIENFVIEYHTPNTTTTNLIAFLSHFENSFRHHIRSEESETSKDVIVCLERFS